MKPDDHLKGQAKPSIEQVAWVFAHLYNHLDGGLFRTLIYKRMGFGLEAYLPLYLAGGMAISDSLYPEEESYQHTIDEALVCACIGVSSGDPKADLNKLICWETQVALDPAVSSEAVKLIERGYRIGLLKAQEITEEVISDFKGDRPPNFYDSHIERSVDLIGASLERRFREQAEKFDAAEQCLPLKEGPQNGA